MKTDNEN